MRWATFPHLKQDVEKVFVSDKLEEMGAAYMYPIPWGIGRVMFRTQTQVTLPLERDHLQAVPLVYSYLCLNEASLGMFFL